MKVKKEATPAQLAYWKRKRGTLLTEEHKRNISAALTGKPKTAEHAAKVGRSLRGKKRPQWSGERHFAWKGEQAHYDSLHEWVARYLGRPKQCSHCPLNDPSRKYHWANISGEYKRELTDWVRLCVPCHSKMDAGRDDLNRVWVRIGNGYVRRNPQRADATS